MKQERIWDFPDKDSDMPHFSGRWQFIERTGQKNVIGTFWKISTKNRAFSAGVFPQN